MIGIDIGSRYIKLCCLRKNEDGLFLVCARMAARPAASPQYKFKAVSGLLRAMAPEGGEIVAAASVGGATASIHPLSLPQLSGKDLEKAIQFESEQVAVSCGWGGAVCDYQTLPSSEENKTEILHVSMPSDEAEGLMDAVEKSGFDLNIVDTDALALANCFTALGPRDYRKKPVLLIDIGHTWTTICALEGGQLRLIRSVEFGGQCIAREIAALYGISAEQAEAVQQHPEIWESIGLPMKNILKRASPPLFESVYRTIEYCMSKKIMMNIDALLISGGTSGLAGLEEFISGVLDVRVLRWNPFTSIDYSEDMKTDLGRFFAVAAGLSLRKEQHV